MPEKSRVSGILRVISGNFFAPLSPYEAMRSVTSSRLSFLSILAPPSRIASSSEVIAPAIKCCVKAARISVDMRGAETAHTAGSKATLIPSGWYVRLSATKQIGVKTGATRNIWLSVQ